MLYEENYELIEEKELDEQFENWSELSPEEDTAFLAALAKSGETNQDIEASLAELGRLADTAGIIVLGAYYQRRNKPEKGTLFGKGWLEDIRIKMQQAGAKILIVNEELSPMQGRNLEKDYHIKTLDRTELILRIFHNHAKTREARLQVRLAELEYQLPRLKRLWEHFDRESGAVRSSGGTATRGMGEKQIEIDKRIIKRDIQHINKILQHIMKHKLTQRKQRDKVKRICLVGYTNAGKSTLFNTLTGADVLVEDKLFATLDSTTRQLKLDKGGIVVISDTVGFISNLPHHLVASFRATLMEVLDANLLLHVVDASVDRFESYIKQVNSVLHDIGADKIIRLLVLNKIDCLDENLRLLLKKRYPYAVQISAAKKINISELLQKIEQLLYNTLHLKLRIPYEQSRFISLLHEKANVIKEDYTAEGTEMEVEINSDDRYHFEQFIVREY